MEYVATKQEIKEYIYRKPFLRIEPHGFQWKVRIGERSLMEGIYTKPCRAEQALKMHVGNVIKTNKKREAKKNAKKAES